jgi:uncharacterized membrane protein
MRLLTILTLLCLASQASAGLRFCNDTDQSATVAIGYGKDGTWVSEGWWRVAADDCTVVIAEDLTRRYYYWRATTPNGAFFVPQSIVFCTMLDAFTIEGDTDCEERGFEKSVFSEADVGKAVEFTVRLTPADAPRPNPEKPAAPALKPAPPKVTDRSPLPTADAFVPLRTVLQGRWEDDKGNGFAMVVNGDRFTDLFNGAEAAKGRYILQQTCPQARLSPVMVLTYDDAPDAPLCWELVVLTVGSLQFRPVNRDAIVVMRKR